MFKTCLPRGVRLCVRFWPEHGFRHGLRFLGLCVRCLHVIVALFFRMCSHEHTEESVFILYCSTSTVGYYRHLEESSSSFRNDYQHHLVDNDLAYRCGLHKIWSTPSLMPSPVFVDSGQQHAKALRQEWKTGIKKPVTIPFGSRGVV